MPRATLQPDSPTTNALSPGSSFSRVRQIADACRTSRTDQNNADKFSRQRHGSGFASPKVSVPATTQPVQLYPQLPGGPVSRKLCSGRSKMREALQRLTSYSPTSFFIIIFFLPEFSLLLAVGQWLARNLEQHSKSHTYLLYCNAVVMPLRRKGDALVKKLIIEDQHHPNTGYNANACIKT